MAFSVHFTPSLSTPINMISNIQSHFYHFSIPDMIYICTIERKEDIRLYGL